MLSDLTGGALEVTATSEMNDGCNPMRGLVISYSEDREHKEYIQHMSN